MHSRWFRILLLAFTTLWFGAVLPGHTRGMITVPGSTNSTGDDTAMGSSCCPSPNKDKSKHKQTDGSCCAICFFVAGLLHYSPVTFDFAPRGQIEVLSIPLAHPAAAILPFQPYQSRAPPAFA
jgi:hypothetical protein